jgi:hypothetical protein
MATKMEQSLKLIRGMNSKVVSLGETGRRNLGHKLIVQISKAFSVLVD